MKEGIEGRQQNIIKRINDNNNNNKKDNSLIPNSREIINMLQMDVEAIIKEREEGLDKEKNILKNKWKKQFSLITNTIDILYHNIY